MLAQPVKISSNLKAVSISILINGTNPTVRRLILLKVSMLCCFLFPLLSFLICISVPSFSDAASNSQTPKQYEPVQFHKLIPYSLWIEILTESFQSTPGYLSHLSP